MIEVTAAGIVPIVGLIIAFGGPVLIRIFRNKQQEGRLARWYLYLFFFWLGSVSVGVGLGLFQAVMALTSNMFEILAVLGLMIGLSIGSILFRFNEDQSVIGIRENKILQYESEVRNLQQQNMGLRGLISKEQKQIDGLKESARAALRSFCWIKYFWAALEPWLLARKNASMALLAMVNTGSNI